MGSKEKILGKLKDKREDKTPKEFVVHGTFSFGKHCTHYGRETAYLYRWTRIKIIVYFSSETMLSKETAKNFK